MSNDPKPCIVCGKSTVCKSFTTNRPRCYGCDGIPPEGEFKEEGLTCGLCNTTEGKFTYGANLRGTKEAIVCTKCLLGGKNDQ